MTIQKAARVFPGLALCLAIGLTALGLSAAAGRSFGMALMDPFTSAILIGMAIRTFVKLPAVFAPGIRFGAIAILEIAVVFLGFSLDLDVFQGGNIAFVGAVLVLVCVMILASFAICRAVGLPEHIAVLIACGNSICGNAAIAAVAPAVRACQEDVVSAVTFSSILGVVLVVSLPFVAPFTGLSAFQFGTFAGLTVYAVPQVVAATAPVSLVSAQVGTAVKLVRVLMLVPAVLMAPLLVRNRDTPEDNAQKPEFHLVKILPWFIPAFVAASLLNNFGLVPAAASDIASELSRGLFIVAMSGLGLSVDLRCVIRTGPKMILGISLSLFTLSLASFLFVSSLV